MGPQRPSKDCLNQLWKNPLGAPARYTQPFLEKRLAQLHNLDPNLFRPWTLSPFFLALDPESYASQSSFPMKPYVLALNPGSQLFKLAGHITHYES